MLHFKINDKNTLLFDQYIVLSKNTLDNELLQKGGDLS